MAQTTVKPVLELKSFDSSSDVFCIIPGGSVVKNPHVMQEIWVQFLVLEDPLEKEMAIHSSILAWEIPRTEEPGRPQSMGSQRVGHDLATTTIFSSTVLRLQIP